MIESITDEELTALALAAEHDPGPDFASEAVPIALGNADSTGHPLPDWYMPAPMGTLRALRGWRRVLALVVIGSFLLINAYGLCSTYGRVSLG